MNGFADRGLSEENFGEYKGVLKSFDAFPKTKPTYLTRSRNGGAWTVILLITCLYLILTETIRWWAGATTHTFTVEKGVSHTLQLNLDVVVAMRCADLHVNVQDAAGDRILAGETLAKDPTSWTQWKVKQMTARVLGLQPGVAAAWLAEDEMADVHDFLGAAWGKRSFRRTPKLRGKPDACRIYGSMEFNKVQGDFHITARGHGYMAMGKHLEHSQFNFSHMINELSFGPFYPSLVNPLDNTVATTPSNFHKFQYYLSVVPTIYTDNPHSRSFDSRNPPPPPSGDAGAAGTSRRDTIYTNQYAVTESSIDVPEVNVPGIFVKYDIEPILITIAEEWGGMLALVVRLVNVVSGVLVAGGWCYQLGGWAFELWGGRGRKGGSGLGVLHGRSLSGEKAL